MADNLYLLLEEFLVKPSKKLKERIHQIALQLFHEGMQEGHTAGLMRYYLFDKKMAREGMSDRIKFLCELLPETASEEKTNLQGILNHKSFFDITSVKGKQTYVLKDSISKVFSDVAKKLHKLENMSDLNKKIMQAVAAIASDSAVKDYNAAHEEARAEHLIYVYFFGDESVDLARKIEALCNRGLSFPVTVHDLEKVKGETNILVRRRTLKPIAEALLESEERNKLFKELEPLLTKNASLSGGMPFEQLSQEIKARLSLSGDEIMPFVMEKMKKHAEEAFPDSTRFIKNSTETPYDPSYIFRITQQQAAVIRKRLQQTKSGEEDLLGAMAFACGKYTDRTESRYGYCSPASALIYDNTTLLRIKAKELRSRGYSNAADTMTKAHNDINELCRNYPEMGEASTLAPAFIDKINKILIDTKDKKEIQEHRGCKKFIVNFLTAISGFGLIALYKTRQDRGSFWYRPTTGSEKILDEFADKIKPTGPSSK